jgi:hypothetical protein
MLEAGFERDRQPAAKLRRLLGRDLGGEEHAFLEIELRRTGA